MHNALPILKTIWRYAIALCEMLMQNAVSNIRTGVESFEEPDTRLYKAEFGDPDEELSTSNKGFAVGQHAISQQLSFRHAYLQGPSGSGKGIYVMINSIFNLLGSTIFVHSPSGDSTDLTSGYMHAKDYKIVTLSFLDPDCSDFYNPLDYVKTDSQAGQLSHLLVHCSMESNASSDFWLIQASNLIKVFILAVLKQPTEYKNLHNVYRLLTVFAGNPSAIHPLFISDKALFTEYRSYAAMDKKLLSNVVTTALAALQLFGDPSIARSTSISTIDFAKLRREKHIVYIQGNVTKSKYLKPITSAFFEQLFNHLLAELPEAKKDLPCFFLIDEASSLKLPTLPVILQNSRKYNLGVLTAWQDWGSVVHQFGTYEAESILSNSYMKIYLSGQGLETSQQLERLLGRTEVKDEAGKTQVRPLMVSEDIRMMKDNEALVICGNKKPLRVPLVAFFEAPFTRMKTKYKPVKCQNDLMRTIPLIPLHETKTQ